MDPHHNLCLRSVHLRSPEEWVTEQGALLFLFPQGGAGSFLAESGVQFLSSGDVLFLNGAAAATFSAPRQREMVFSYFVVNPEQFASIFVGREIGFLRKLLEGSNRFRLFPASSAFAAECHHQLDRTPPRFNLAHRSHLLGVAGAILSDEFDNVEAEHSGFISFKERLTQVLENLTVEEILALSAVQLATRFSCSRRHLNRLFNDHFGLSVGALRMEMRLAKAAWLLRGPGAKVINIAGESGFNHLGLFNTCFKRRFGVSPTQFRKEQAANGETAVDHASQEPGCPMRSVGLCPWQRKAAVRVPNGSELGKLGGHSARESAADYPPRPGSGITFRIRGQGQKAPSLASNRSASLTAGLKRVSFTSEPMGKNSVSNARSRHR